jgi:hypothetical protein
MEKKEFALKELKIPGRPYVKATRISTSAAELL